jgi:Zn-dependent peptidase ImmA (M78 family)
MLLNILEILSSASGARSRAALTRPPFSTHHIQDACFPDVLVTGDVLPEGVAEMVIEQGDKRTIIYNRRLPVPTQRVAIAHALGHLAFDDAIGNVHRDAVRYNSSNMVERRADLFAGELLVPLSEIDRVFDTALFPTDPVEVRVFDDAVDRCASLFAVPTRFIRWRLWDLLHLRRSNFFIKDRK